MRRRISIRGCVRPSVGPSVRRSVPSYFQTRTRRFLVPFIRPCFFLSVNCHLFTDCRGLNAFSLTSARCWTRQKGEKNSHWFLSILSGVWTNSTCSWTASIALWRWKWWFTRPRNTRTSNSSSSRHWYLCWEHPCCCGVYLNGTLGPFAMTSRSTKIWRSFFVHFRICRTSTTTRKWKCSRCRILSADVSCSNASLPHRLKLISCRATVIFLMLLVTTS